ncbi:hypothetical protein Agub_g6507 [Astrephomene gubernaculifera]|uniref:Uncharacterized protein n=1 Tax=Astrephomene gubernaculifera TaxID=47775 RepID=A0AAD3HLH7_9CHLO|nr:hypothetical protein Agub_g6507 [Astrephomene gubernaculifera]
MGKLDPSQLDRWWKSRIEKEELQYALKAGLQEEAARAQQKEVAFLNTLGSAQVTSRASETNASTGPKIRSARDGAGRPKSAWAGSNAGASEAAAATSPKSVVKSVRMDDARSIASGASGSQAAGGNGGGTVKLPSVACSQRTSKVSQAKADSQAALMRRLEGLEEALSAERVKRQQAEEEMRQLMQMAAQQRRANR